MSRLRMEKEPISLPRRRNTIRLIHWNAKEAAEKSALLRGAGYKVVYSHLRSSTDLPAIMRHAPDAFVIDLSRLPMQGRDVALTLRRNKSSRQVPILFVDGATEKVERVRKSLPDASYATWKEIRSSLKRAIARPLQNPVVPVSSLAGYSGTPLSKKLGIRPNSLTVLVNAPDTFEETLGSLPPGAKLQRRSGRRSYLSLWFVRSSKELNTLIGGIAERTDRLWIIWPKKASGVKRDVAEGLVREVGLASGLVDYKVCAIDSTWSGLLFVRRKIR